MLTLITAPTVEPLDLAEAKAHLRVDVTADDALIDSLITAAREHVEAVTGRALTTQVWELFLDAFPTDEEFIEIPKAPLSSLQDVSYVDADTGTTVAATLADFTTLAPVGERAGRGSVGPGPGKAWPTNVSTAPLSARIRFVAGYGAASAVPAGIKAAILLIVGDLYANREARLAGNLSDNPTVERLLFPFKLLTV